MAELKSHKLSELRRRAEVQLSRIIRRSVPSLARENVKALVQELRVHQIELELQCHELQRAQAEVGESRNRYLELYESIPVGYVTIDSDGRIYDLNPMGVSLLGLERDSRRMQNFFCFFGDGDADAGTLFCREVIAHQEANSCELNMKTAAGSPFIGALQGAPVQVGEGKGDRLRISFRDITRRRQAEETLRQHQVELEANRIELQDLMEKFLTAQEEERRRIACDLHDDQCQRITALILEAGTLTNLVKLTMPTLVPRIESWRQRLSDILNDMRHLTHELHPRHLDTVSLGFSMQSHINEFSNYTGLHIDFHEEDVPNQLTMPITICLYRLLQETLGNIHKHAHAAHVTVRLSGSPSEITLVVADNGTGFDLGGTKDHNKKGLGLTSMQERVRPLQGRVSIDSGSGRGTTVTVSIPLPCVS
jgi:PAS domain S-box-containing protein